MRAVTAILAAVAIFAAATSTCLAFSQSISVPAGTVSVTIATVGTNNTTGQTTYSTVNSFCPSGATVTVNQPNNTSSTTYGSSVSFTDAGGNLISVATVVQVADDPNKTKNQS